MMLLAAGSATFSSRNRSGSPSVGSGASLRLRTGDAAALDEYYQHGRIRGAHPEQAMDQAARGYVASYLAGRDTLLMARPGPLPGASARIRDDLIHLGLVDRGPRPVADGATPRGT